MDDWQYLERQVVTDPQGRQWSVALMDLLGQSGDPETPSEWAELEYTGGRYFTVIYSASGGLQWERAHPTRSEAARAYQRLVASVGDGRLDPAQPVFREDLTDC